jgi:hypothetical protein
MDALAESGTIVLDQEDAAPGLDEKPHSHPALPLQGDAHWNPARKMVSCVGAPRSAASDFRLNAL